MQPLEKSLRGKLERAVREARDIAEAAAWQRWSSLVLARLRRAPI